VPDVSANAGAGYAIYCTLAGPLNCNPQGWTGLGGTSAAAPTWAALFALADASTACATTGPVGLANPALYAIAGQDYAGTFNDIMIGNNDLAGAPGGQYQATPGYDLTSGLGTPIAENSSGGGLVPDLCSSSSKASTRASLPAPTVVDVRPSTIRARSGVHVTITGTNLSNAVAVYFGSLPALSFKVTSRSTISAVAPDGAGLVHVTVTTAEGASRHVRADLFDYLVRPQVKRVAPPSGPPTGRTVILIGRDFTGTVQVLFGATPARTWVVLSSSRIEAVAPPGRGTVTVTVRTRGGASAPTAKFTYAS